MVGAVTAVLSIVYCISSGFFTLRPASQIRPTKPFHTDAKHILPIMKNYIYKICVDLVECNIFRRKHIMQDIWFSNCCATAHVVSPKKFEELWSIWIGWTVTDASTRVSPANSCCIRGSSQQGLQHAFDRFSAVWDHEGKNPPKST